MNSALQFHNREKTSDNNERSCSLHIIQVSEERDRLGSPRNTKVPSFMARKGEYYT